MAHWEKVAKLQDIPEGTGVASQVGEDSVALFNCRGEIFSVQSRCPHRGAPLVEGELNDNVLTCPWHAWQFDVKTGCYVDNPELKIKSYPVRVQSDDVYILTD